MVQLMELVAAEGKEQPLKSSALDLLCSSDQIGILCDYINLYRTLMQQTEYHIYDREWGAENVALTLKALPQRKEAELSLYCACERSKRLCGWEQATPGQTWRMFLEPAENKRRRKNENYSKIEPDALLLESIRLC